MGLGCRIPRSMKSLQHFAMYFAVGEAQRQNKKVETGAMEGGVETRSQGEGVRGYGKWAVQSIILQYILTLLFINPLTGNRNYYSTNCHYAHIWSGSPQYLSSVHDRYPAIDVKFL